jgi:hypothetical protein
LQVGIIAILHCASLAKSPYPWFITIAAAGVAPL